MVAERDSERTITLGGRRRHPVVCIPDADACERTANFVDDGAAQLRPRTDLDRDTVA
jgi:hypothetical protein